MNTHLTHLECSLECPWRDTCQCLRVLVKPSVLLGGHLGGAQLAGVHALYYPQAVPPCVKPEGALRWDDFDDGPEPDPVLWGDERPEL